jgi:hypothetical protein
MDEDIVRLIAEEFGRWGIEVNPRAAAKLAAALMRQRIEIGEIGATCAVIGFVIGRGGEI